MGRLGGARVPPDQLAVQMGGDGADALGDLCRQLESAGEDVSGLRNQLREDAVEDLGAGGVRGARGEQVRRVAVADHAGQKEGARGFHREADARERGSRISISGSRSLKK